MVPSELQANRNIQSSGLEACAKLLQEQTNNATMDNYLLPCGPDVVDYKPPTADNIDSLIKQYCTPQCATAFQTLTNAYMAFGKCPDPNFFTIRSGFQIARFCTRDAAGNYCSRKSALLQYFKGSISKKQQNIIVCENLDCVEATMYSEIKVDGLNVLDLKQDCIKAGYLRGGAVPLNMVNSWLILVVYLLYKYL
jgi:hypothetical protein